MKVRLILFFLCASLLCSSALAQDIQLAGSQNVLWLVRGDAQASSFTIYVRPAGEKWKVVSAGLTGSVDKVAAADRSLHIIFRNPLGHALLNLGSNDLIPLPIPAGPGWPAQTQPLAVCGSSRSLSGSHRPSLIAVVPQSVQPAMAPSRIQTQAATTAATGPAGSPRALHLTSLAIMEYTEAAWRTLTQTEPMPMLPQSPVGVTVAGGRLYLLLQMEGRLAVHEWTAPSAATTEPAQLPTQPAAAATQGSWRVFPLPQNVASGKPLALLTVQNRPVVVIAQESQSSKFRAILLVLEEEDFTVNVIQSQNVEATWDSDNIPAAAQLGDHVELVWLQNDKLMWARSSLAGVMGESAEIQAIPSSDEQVRQASDYFMMIVVLLVFFLVIMTRPKGPPKPFLLPKGMVRGPLFRRLVAAMIDLLPWLWLAMWIKGLHRLTMDDLRLLGQTETTNLQDMIYAQMIGFILFVTYCIIMELTLGATVGKRIMGLRVVGEDGKRLDLRSALIRNLMKIVEFYMAVPVQWLQTLLLPLLLLFPILSRYHQRIGDMMARTAIIDARRSVLTTPPPISTDNLEQTQSADQKDSDKS